MRIKIINFFLKDSESIINSSSCIDELDDLSIKALDKAIKYDKEDKDGANFQFGKDAAFEKAICTVFKYIKL